MKTYVASLYRSFGVGFGGRVEEDMPNRVCLRYRGKVYVLSRDELNSAPLVDAGELTTLAPSHLDRTDGVSDDGIPRVQPVHGGRK